MLTVFVDARSTEGQPTGIGVFTQAVLDSWDALPDDERPEVKPLQRSLGSGIRWHLRAWRSVRKAGATYYSPDSLIVPMLAGAKAAVSIHDLTAILHPEGHALRVRIAHRLLMPPAVRRVGAIMVPTEAIRGDLVGRFPKAARKTTVVHYGSRFSTDDDDSATSTAAARPRPYVLSVGLIEPRKNTIQLIEAFVSGADPGWDLLIVGRMGPYSPEDIARFERLVSDNDRIQWLGYVTDEDLAGLYEGAAAMAYPSAAEGFGLPALEAMTCGVPLLTTDDPALAELTGGCALVVSARFTQGELTDAVRRITTDADLRTELSRKGLARAADFSWGRTGRETLRVLEKVGR